MKRNHKRHIKKSMYTTKHIIISTIVGILLGLLAMYGVFYMKFAKITTQRSQALIATMSKLPVCKDGVTFTDDTLIKQGIAYDVATIPTLKNGMKVLTDNKAQDIFASEIAREQKEIASLQSIYKSLYNKSYEPSNQELAVWSSDSFTVTNSEVDPNINLVNVLMGRLLHKQSDYYTYVLISSNKDLQQIATNYTADEDVIFKKMNAFLGQVR